MPVLLQGDIDRFRAPQVIQDKGQSAENGVLVADTSNRKELPGDVSETLSLLTDGDYIAGRDLATVVYLALQMGRPM